VKQRLGIVIVVNHYIVVPLSICATNRTVSFMNRIHLLFNLKDSVNWAVIFVNHTILYDNVGRRLLLPLPTSHSSVSC